MIKTKFKLGVDFKFNPDKDHVKCILEGVRANNGHCPCELIHTPDTKCMCTPMRESMICKCQLYVPVNNSGQDKL